MSYGIAKTAVVVSVGRLKLSPTGNPNWMIQFDDGTTHRTAPNAIFSYGITEYNFVGKTVSVSLSPAGRITDMVEVSE